MIRVLLTSVFALLCLSTFGQAPFNYRLELTPVSVSGLPGLHSFAFAQHDGKWLIIGGRKDGLHARQPFNSFPQAQNNTDMYVVDVKNGQYWTASLNSLPIAIAEQLQSTNMNFHQEGDTLFIIGGYSYTTSATDHITHSGLVSVQISSVVQAIINNSSFTSYFKQMTDTAFAVTGGHLGKIGDEFYLIGGHRFDGRYNPMGNPTYTQAYTSQIRKFKIDNSGSQLSFYDYSVVTDPVHLRRRDYNLLPQIFPDGTEGYTISSGVFQLSADLPFLYPVDIKASGHTPVTSFNQYLSNYHSATTALYDSNNNAMHMLFYGGMSQYYYQNGSLVKDDNVPFVKTISRLTRDANGNLQEYQLPIEMPALKGASAEFIPNMDIAQYGSGIIKMNAFSTDTVLLGYIYGGIYSSAINPFTNNQTANTNADNTIYAVRLIKDSTVSVPAIKGDNPYTVTIHPNPANGVLNMSISNTKFSEAKYYLSTIDGRVLFNGSFGKEDLNQSVYQLHVEDVPAQLLLLTVVFDDVYYTVNRVEVK